MNVQCGSTSVDVLEVVKIAKRAGVAIMAIYEGEKDKWEVEMKSDASPLTAANREANRVICEALSTLYPNLPIVSEENESLAYEERKNWQHHFCVDPLDGTKDFIKHGERSVYGQHRRLPGPHAHRWCGDNPRTGRRLLGRARPRCVQGGEW